MMNQKKRKEGQMSKIGLVIGREYTSRVKKKSFLILTLLVPLLIGGMGFLAVWLGMESDKHQKVLVSDPRNLCDAKIFISHDENPPATFYFTEEMVMREDFENMEKYQEYDVFIALDPDVITNKTIRGVTREKISGSTHRYIAKKLEMRLEEYFALDEGIPLDKYRKIKQSYKFKTSLVGEDPEDAGCSPEEIGQGVGLGFSVMIYIFLMVYGGMVMRGVMEEKQGRVVEIVVSSVRPFDLMFGKIIGIGLVGLTQFVIWFVVISAVMIFVQPLLIGEMAAAPEMGVGMMPEDVAAQMSEMNCVYVALYDYINWPVLLIMFVIYFIGGYLLYGSLFAIVGAAADSESDTQQLVIPIMIPLTFVYILSFSMIGDPEASSAIWGSHVPLSSPIIMLQRIGSGTVVIWEVLLSLSLLVATFIFTTYLAGKVYRVGILMYGKKVTWKEIFKWMRYK
jgi:ABC-2 type transport system permease protein